MKSGDTVAAIAAKARITAATIISANDLGASALIKPGQVLVLPGVAPAVQRSATPRAAVVVHAVKAGDTVMGIAARYKISPGTIIRANKLGPTAMIYPGRKLVLPGVLPPKPAAVPAAPPTHPYTVKDGDTLHAICADSKLELATVLALNHLTVDDVLHPGQQLLLPGAPPSTVPNTFLGRTYSDAVAQAAAANRATLAARTLPKRAEMQSIVVAVAKSLGVDPSLAQAIAYQESGFDQRVVSPANAIGTMQVIPSTGAWASQLVGHPLNLLDPKDNATAGVAVLAALLAQAPEPDAIAGYYQGLGSVRKNGMYDDTRRYVANVETLKARFALGGGTPGSAPPPLPSSSPAASPSPSASPQPGTQQ